MMCSVSGDVSEAQSGLPIPRLLVVAYDKNILFDDLLGTAETEENGTFKIQFEYNRSVLSGTEEGPDLYVAVFAPPCQRLVDTSARVRFRASENETFNLRVDPDILAEYSVGDADLDFSDDLAEAFEWEVG